MRFHGQLGKRNDEAGIGGQGVVEGRRPHRCSRKKRGVCEPDERTLLMAETGIELSPMERNWCRKYFFRRRKTSFLEDSVEADRTSGKWTSRNWLWRCPHTSARAKRPMHHDNITDSIKARTGARATVQRAQRALRTKIRRSDMRYGNTLRDKDL